jgi:hypothetical protein
VISGREGSCGDDDVFHVHLKDGLGQERAAFGFHWVSPESGRQQADVMTEMAVRKSRKIRPKSRDALRQCLHVPRASWGTRVKAEMQDDLLNPQSSIPRIQQLANRFTV